jgi:glycosyltransferase involved in cell wall biosynthesis
LILSKYFGEAALLVDPGDTQSNSDAMDRVLSDSDLRAALPAKGLARSGKFTWDICAKKTLATLEGLASWTGNGENVYRVKPS